MKSIRRGRNALLGVLALLLIGAAGFGSAWAWSVQRAEQKNNLESHTVAVSIEENFPDKEVKAGRTQAKEVTLKNTGTAAAFVRVCYAEYWTKDSGHLTGQTSVTKNWTSEWADFELAADGWYYYKKVLPAGKSVKVLNSVTFPSSVETNASYHLDFQVETVQVSDEPDVNKAATKQLMGRTGEVESMTTASGAVTGGTVKWTD